MPLSLGLKLSHSKSLSGVLLSLALVFSGCRSRFHSNATGSLPRLARTIPLSGVRGTRPDVGVPGRIDHMAYDPGTKRLFIAALENGSLEVVNLDQGRRIRSISGLERPQGAAIVSLQSSVAVACGGDGRMHVFDTQSLKETATLLIGSDADNVRYDKSANAVYVSYGDTNAGAIAVLDAANWKCLSVITFISRPESFQLDPAANRLFANLPGGLRAVRDGAVAIADLAGREAQAAIGLTRAARNFPMAYDADHERLFIASRRPAKLIVIDTRRAKVIAEAPCIDDSDDLFYDAQTRRVFVIGGGFRPDLQEPNSRSSCSPPGTMGAIDTFSVANDGALERSGNVPTAPHARTGIWVPSRRALYVAVPMQEGRDPEIREYLVD